MSEGFLSPAGAGGLRTRSDSRIRMTSKIRNSTYVTRTSRCNLLILQAFSDGYEVAKLLLTHRLEPFGPTLEVQVEETELFFIWSNPVQLE